MCIHKGEWDRPARLTHFVGPKFNEVVTFIRNANVRGYIIITPYGKNLESGKLLMYQRKLFVPLPDDKTLEAELSTIPQHAHAV